MAASAPLIEIRGVRFTRNSSYWPMTVTLTTLNLTPVRVTGTTCNRFYFTTLRAGFDPTICREAGALPRRLKATAASVCRYSTADTWQIKLIRF